MFVRTALSSLALVAMLAGSSAAQSWMGAGPYGYQTAQPAPWRPLPSSPFMYYDLLGGYARTAITAPQPIGHEHIATGPNGYIYRPVYASPPSPPPPPAPPAGVQRPAEVQPRATGTTAPNSLPPPTSGARQLNDSPRPAPAPLDGPAAPAGPRAF